MNERAKFGKSLLLFIQFFRLEVIDHTSSFTFHSLSLSFTYLTKSFILHRLYFLLQSFTYFTTSFILHTNLTTFFIINPLHYLRYPSSFTYIVLHPSSLIDYTSIFILHRSYLVIHFLSFIDLSSFFILHRSYISVNERFIEFICLNELINFWWIFLNEWMKLLWICLNELNQMNFRWMCLYK